MAEKILKEIETNFEITGKSPLIVAGVCLYVASLNTLDHPLKLVDISDCFEVTDVSIRSIKKLITPTLNKMNLITTAFGEDRSRKI